MHFVMPSSCVTGIKHIEVPVPVPQGTSRGTQTSKR
uniref:Uncharacterized protein n=1 Tax=Anguilla anguilla TaxID=7936 RepID=A0A0E9VSM9_ANGAN